MPILNPDMCATGKCTHAKFPHYLVETVSHEVSVRRTGIKQGTFVRERVIVPAMRFIICLTCRHWPWSGAAAKCLCRVGCHALKGDGHDLYGSFEEVSA